MQSSVGLAVVKTKAIHFIVVLCVNIVSRVEFWRGASLMYKWQTSNSMGAFVATIYDCPACL
jgi:hypothetical protein